MTPAEQARRESLAADGGADERVGVRIAQRAVIAIILGLGLVATVYGLVRFDWQARAMWPRQELMAVLVALAAPAGLLIIGSFLATWTRFAAVAVMGGLLVTYGPATIAVLAFCALGFAAVGRLVFRVRLASIEDGLLAMVLGYGLCGVIIGLSATVRVHFDFVYAAVFLGAIFLSRRDIAHLIVQTTQRLWAPQPASMVAGTLGNLGISAALAVAIALMLYASSREGGFDALVTHLYFTDALREDGFIPLSPELSPAVFMPKAAIWGLSIVDIMGGEFAVKAANACLLLAAAALVGMRAARWMGRGPAGLLIATFLSAPVVNWVSSQLFEEAGTLALTAGAAVFFLRGDRTAIENTPQQGATPGLSFAHADLLALACLGMAVSSKAQALFLGVIGVAVVVRRLATDLSPRGFRDVAIGGAVFLAVATPFYLRAFLMTGNAFYPYSAGETVDTRWEHPLSYLTPFGMVFQTGFMEAWPGGFAFQFLLLLSAGIAALFLLRLRSISALAIAALAFAVVLATQTAYARYQLYGFPLLMLAFAAVFPLTTLFGRAVLSAALLALTALNLWFWPSVHVGTFSLAQLAAPQIVSEVPPERRAFGALNELFGRQAVVYVAGGSPFSAGISGTPHGFSKVWRELAGAQTTADVARIFSTSGVTHVVATEPVRNPVVIEACAVLCAEFPLGDLPVRIFRVDQARASVFATRTDAAELLGLPPPLIAEPLAGWSREDWGWWSNAPEAQIQLSRGYVGARKLDFRVQAFAPPGTDGLDVTLLLDGTEVGAWRFEPGPPGVIEMRTIELPVAIGADAAGVLTLRFSHTYEPRDTIGGSDARTLALGFISVTR